MESATIMETSLNGLGLGVPSVSQLKSSAVPVVLGAVGAGVGLFAVGKLLSYPLPGVGAIDAKLDSLLPSKPGLLPGVARVGIAVVAIPMAAAAVTKFTKVRVPTAALAGASALVALVGLKMALQAAAPDLASKIPGFGGAALLTESVGGPFAGAALGVEEAGKFGGLGATSSPGFASVMGASGHY